jgi:hypothetical protein
MGKFHRALKRSVREKTQLTLLKRIDSRLMDLGLDKDQISQQSIKQLGKSLHRIDGYIIHPESFLKQKFKDTVNSETLFKLNLLPILLERRMLVLDSIDELLSRREIANLRRLIKRISNVSVKSSVKKIINDLQIKNSILKKEYQKLEKLRIDIYSEQQQFLSTFEGSTKRGDKTSKYFQSRESMTTLMLGILLILITLFIAIAPFVNIQVPDILNSTFFIILGFFFCQTIERLLSLKGIKKPG